jgi:imidazolonepropionase-like amidohydrolase
MECRRLRISNLRSAALIALGFAAGPLLAQEGGTGRPAAPPPDPASSFVLRDVTIVDVVRGELHAGRTVTVENGWIRSIGADGASSPFPPDRRVIDGAGGYLVPGLWDMHAHPLPTTGEGGGWWEPDPETSFALLVANGVTGVRDMWGSLEVAAPLARERRSRDRRWPRVLTPGGIIDGPVPYYPSLIAVGSSDEARSAVDSLSAGGADFIKVYSSLPEDLFLVIVERARSVGLDVAGHVPAAVPARTASEAGMKSFEHLYGVLEGCSSIEGRLLADNVAFLDARAAGRNSTRDDRLWFERLLGTQDDEKCRALLLEVSDRQTWQVPTLAALAGVFRLRDPGAAEDRRLAYVDPRARAFWGLASYDETRSFGDTDWELRQRRFDRVRQVVRMMVEAGVPILAGSDFHPTVAFTFPGFSLHDELELLVEAGLSSLQALQASTIEPARFLGATDSLGTVEPGRIADLVLLGGNPLQDIRNTRDVRGVALAGRWLPRDSLDALLASVEEGYRDAEPPTLPELPAGADRTLDMQSVRGGIRLVFLLDPGVVEASLPGFLDPLEAVELAGRSPAVDAFLAVNSQYRSWYVSGLEFLLADSASVDGGTPRRSAEVRWWLETSSGSDGTTGPGPIAELSSAESSPPRILLASWGPASRDHARIDGREFDSGTWSFRLDDLSVRIDLVCTPGGARSRFPTDQSTSRIAWEGDRTPEWFEISSRTGELGRDCDLRMSAEGLHPLATGLKRAPLLRGPEVGARLIESGRARSALYRVD